LQLPPLVSKAVKIFSENIDEPIGISEIAERLEISERQIERSFKQSTGLSPSHYYRKMRMEAARQLVLYTNDKIPDVAASVGYLSTQPFVRHYTSAHGLTPAEDRMRINQFRYNSNLPVPSV
jgi:transcriptional regulator GlxA family with amidase domain